METRFLLLDLDGTLLDDNKQVTAENRAAMSRGLDAGHRIVLASGRPLASVLQQAADLGLDGPGCYVSAFNGGILYDCGAGREICHASLTMDQLSRLFAEARRRDLYIQTYNPDAVLVERGQDTAVTERYCDAVRMPYRVVEDVGRALSGPPPKAVMLDFTGREKLEPMRQWVEREMAGEVACFYSSPYLLEAEPYGIDKGKCVADLCALLHTGPERFIAVGDEANDIPMIRAAGVGVAMRNAVPEAKAAADYVTERDNNHSGVAEVIARFLLPQQG